MLKSREQKGATGAAAGLDFLGIIRISPTWKGMRTRAVPHSVPLSSAAGGGTRRQTCLSVSEFLASRHWRAAQGSPQGRHRRLSLYLFWTSKRSMPGGEQRQFDGQLNDDRALRYSFTGRAFFSDKDEPVNCRLSVSDAKTSASVKIQCGQRFVYCRSNFIPGFWRIA